MPQYYVNTISDNKGDHEVHKEQCNWMPSVNNRKPLGWHSTCREAVQAARVSYPTANGCIHCSRECHTS